MSYKRILRAALIASAAVVTLTLAADGRANCPVYPGKYEDLTSDGWRLDALMSSNDCPDVERPAYRDPCEHLDYQPPQLPEFRMSNNETSVLTQAGW